MSSKKQVKLQKAYAKEVEKYILQFKKTCFGRVVKIGDPKKYREAIARLFIIQNAKIDKDAKAQHRTKEGLFIAPFSEMLVPFNLLGKKLTYEQRKTLFHEATHQIEQLHGDKRDKKDPTADRNTDYLDQLIDSLRQWKKYEEQLIKGVRTPAEAQKMFSILHQRIYEIEREFYPDVSQMQHWDGIYSIPANAHNRGIRFEDIRNYYLHCGYPALRQLALHYKYVPKLRSFRPSCGYIAAGVWKCPKSLEGAAYIGSGKSNIYHDIFCRYAKAIQVRHRLCFESKAAARKYHYIPCKVCHP